MATNPPQISASPSPYARKVRIALQEKKLPFTLQTEVPWDTTTKTPQYNPLEKLPVLILDDGKTAIYESHYIMEWLEAKYPETSLMPDDVDGKLFAKQVEVITDGICDALVLAFFENKREEGKQSGPWKERCVSVTLLLSFIRLSLLIIPSPDKCAKPMAACKPSPPLSIKPAEASS